ncbi:hypothetical protein CEXT_35961 [Caerostris extrusa]|uniref:Uncharacterized protein n=1 Tax=Caerostris extrusa TaxID=172846 RepID=A0AAV4MFM2_CAEEX|nr:hypothetical protein CEXT_35961 [Caerostris extrusa]
MDKSHKTNQKHSIPPSTPCCPFKTFPRKFSLAGRLVNLSRTIYKRTLEVPDPSLFLNPVTNGFYDGVSNLLAKPRREKNTTGVLLGNYFGPSFYHSPPHPSPWQPKRFQ